ncbi:protein of unknown function [Candidatus Hydrogenisulfobacillus filiaventi]|uniref:Uncharacterized protein n=1 Tax=Candidatus Hydrogenisulfobacillus filiaventi TaxID=2707344 RepID=A0A6F8ZFM3_9FIRM|nr:protein of unknown function [Candidatus Hydrogenisulfobacillus filiaventi]
MGRSWPQVILAPTALLPPSLPPREAAGGGEEGVLVCADPEGPWRPVRLSASQLLYVAARIARHLHLAPGTAAGAAIPSPPWSDR